MLIFNKRKKEMKYIKVTNKADEVNRLKLEKLGFSTKRDNDETIGQFGSGIKFAPIAAIRKGMEFVFAGADAKGSYTLEYIIKDEEGIPSVFYKYPDYEKPSSFTADAGLLSWENDFQIYREVIANAVDEAKISGKDWSVDIVDVEKIIPVDGEFSVYITATDSLFDIHDNFDKYFSFNREPIVSHEGMKLYHPIDDTFRVYCKGVLVYSADKLAKSFGSKETKGIFDYEFDELSLNEERTVASTWDMNSLIVRVLAKTQDVEFAKSLLEVFNTQMYEDYYEFNHIPSYHWDATYINSGSLEDAFREVYPKHILVEYTKMSINSLATIKSKGYETYNVYHEGIFKFLKSCELPTFESLFGEYFEYGYTFDISGYPMLTTAINIVNDVIPDTCTVNEFIGVFMVDDKADATCALTTNMKLSEDDEIDKKILFKEDYLESASLIQLISTFIHEWDHYRSGLTDGDMNGRMFRDLADETIGNLIYELWKTKRKVAKV